MSPRQRETRRESAGQRKTAHKARRKLARKTWLDGLLYFTDSVLLGRGSGRVLSPPALMPFRLPGEAGSQKIHKHTHL